MLIGRGFHPQTMLPGARAGSDGTCLSSPPEKNRMLSANTLAYLSTLTYRADAKLQVSILPLGSIFWDDEMPPMHEFIRFPETDREEVLRVFALRIKIWDGAIL